MLDCHQILGELLEGISISVAVFLAKEVAKILIKGAKEAIYVASFAWIFDNKSYQGKSNICKFEFQILNDCLFK